MNKLKLKGRGITSGVAEGEAIVTAEPFSFSHGLDPTTGQIFDVSDELLGQSVKGKVLIFPYGKGSSTGSLYVIEAARLNNTPAAVINVETEPVIAGGFVLARILYNKEVPVVDRLDRNPIEVIKTGDWVKVDADNGTVEIQSLQEN